MNVTFDDKDKTVKDGVRNKVRDVDMNELKNAINSKGDALVFVSDPTLVLPAEYTFGKYKNGDTPAWTGLTLMEAILDCLVAYINPAFSSFSVSGQSVTVEVGTTLSGSKTFLWSITVNSGVVATIDIKDVTAATTLVSGTANDGTQAVTIATIQLNANGSTQVWKGTLHDTGGVIQNIDSAVFTVTSRFKVWYAEITTSLTNSASVRALANTFFYTSGTTFDLAIGTSGIKRTVALPPGVTITHVSDVNNLGNDITSNYVLQSSINVLDAGGTNRAYNIYEMNDASPYSSPTIHRFTIS
jgi:hypothetical protein